MWQNRETQQSVVSKGKTFSVKKYILKTIKLFKNGKNINTS